MNDSNLLKHMAGLCAVAAMLGLLPVEVLANNDPYVRNHNVEAGALKPEEFRGTYLSPEFYGQPKERGQHYDQHLVRPEPADEPVLLGDVQ